MHGYMPFTASVIFRVQMGVIWSQLSGPAIGSYRTDLPAGNQEQWQGP